MSRLVLPVLLLAACGLQTACVVAPYRPAYRSEAYVSPDGPVVVAGVAPPAPYEEVLPPMPYAGAIWIGGYWGWNAGRHVWIGGRWDHARPGFRWEPHRWERVGGKWHLHEGGWRKY
jgi:hypothetical protein